MRSDKTQTIGLLNMHLSEQMKQKFIHQAEIQTKTPFSEMNGATSVDLGMETVPVLNQGIHGSCVTFSVTAAIDAILKKVTMLANYVVYNWVVIYKVMDMFPVVGKVV